MVDCQACLHGIVQNYRAGGKRQSDHISHIVSSLNRDMARNTANDRYVTLLFAHLNPHTRELSYVSAGHPAGYVLNASGDVKMTLNSTATVVGVNVASTFPASDKLTLEPGDLVLFLTDGILEARSGDNATFGKDRAINAARTFRADSASAIANHLYRAVRDFSRNTSQDDDITAVVLKVDTTP